MNKVERKRLKEKQTVTLMIALYCKANHSNNLCEECKQLIVYARDRSDKCPFMENKTFCSNCKVHCYKPDMREKIKKVMKYSGPRMIFHHPIMAISHLISSKVEKIRMENIR